MTFCPDRGDVDWMNLNLQAGREQAGRRPVLVLTHKRYNERVGLAIVCPVTSKSKGYVFEVVIPGGFAVNGVILSDHAKSSDWRRREMEFICRLPKEIVDALLAKLNALLES